MNQVYPLANELYILDQIRELVPKHQFVDLDVRTLGNDEIKLIQEYASVVLPYDTMSGRYAIFRSIADRLDRIYEELSSYDLVLAPGDSPSKYLLSLKLCGFKLPVVQFPISGLGKDVGISAEEQALLDDYIAYLLRDYNFSNTVDMNRSNVDKKNSITNIAIFDYSSTGATFNYLKKSIQKALPQVTKIKLVNIPEFRGSYDLEHRKLMVDGEILNSRCVSKYTVSKLKTRYPESLYAPNVTKCNIICLLVAITYFERLQPIKIKRLEIEYGAYNATYYHPDLDRIITGMIVNVGDQLFEPIFDIKEYLRSQKREKIPYLTLIKINSKLTTSENLNQYAGEITSVHLIDGSVLEVYFQPIPSIPGHVLNIIGYLIPLTPIEVIDMVGQKKISDGEIFNYYDHEEGTSRLIVRLEGKYYFGEDIDRSLISEIF